MSYDNLKPHWTRRKPIKRSAMKPRKGKVWKKLSPITKNKEKRAKRFIPKEIVKQVIERAGGQCECRSTKYVGTHPITGSAILSSIRCMKRAEEIHHVLPRSRGGKHTLDNLLHLCREHHALCKSHPNVARGLEILK